MTENTVIPEDKSIIPVNATLFREGMSRLAASVHLVTTGGPAGEAGMTATAVTSVTDMPPTLLVCINSSSRSYKVLESNGVFAVNVLAPSDTKIADIFAGRGDISWEERFNIGEWSPLETGAPVLSSALVSFDCRVSGTSTVSSHKVVFGEVVAVYLGKPGEALTYYERRYRSL